VSVEDEGSLDDAIAALPFADIFDVEMVKLESLKEALAKDEKLLKPAPKAKNAGKGRKTK
jgi:hypothetical protein